MPISISILYDKSELQNNVMLLLNKNLTHVAQHITGDTLMKAHLLDPKEPLHDVDIQFHIAVPVYSAISWARVNVLIIDPVKYVTESYQSYLHAFDLILFQSVNDQTTWASEYNTQVCDMSDMTHMKDIIEGLIVIVHERKPKGIHRMPPILSIEDCPSISVITPTYNRRKLLDIAFNNMLSTDYPRSKIQWIIIEDHEDSTQMATDKVIKFQQACPEISMKYIPIQGRMSIGQKRNLAVDQADHEIVLFMDDDDHYPPTSFRRRVAWLLGGEKKGQKGFARIACCTMIAMYDLMTGISAVNVPPMNLPLSQRVSEATFTFYKSAWLERKFKEVSIAEGEDWIAGREHEIIEIPCQHIIVAFSHQGNQSSRRVPKQKDKAPSCFWGFSREYLIFIHRLVGVEIEEDTSDVSSKSRRKK